MSINFTGAITVTANGTTVQKIVRKSDGVVLYEALIYINSVPSQSGSLTYNGSSQSPSWSNYNSTQLTIGGTTSATNAGSYTATFTPKSGCCWSDGSTSAKSVSWSIGRKAVTIPSQSGSLEYTGSSQSPTWSNYNTTYMTIGGTTSGTDVGSYTATFTLKSNYKWSSGSTSAKSVTWSIDKATPTITVAGVTNGGSIDITDLYPSDIKLNISCNKSFIDVTNYTLFTTTYTNTEWECYASSNGYVRIYVNNGSTSSSCDITLTLNETDNYNSATVSFTAIYSYTGIEYWSIPYNSSSSTSCRYSVMISKTATVDSSGNFTLQNATALNYASMPPAGYFSVSLPSSPSNQTGTTGKTLYYFYNSSAQYYEFSSTIDRAQSSSSAVSKITSTTHTADVAYDNGKLLLKTSLVPNYYRWEYWVTSGGGYIVGHDNTKGTVTWTSNNVGGIAIYGNDYYTLQSNYLKPINANYEYGVEVMLMTPAHVGQTVSQSCEDAGMPITNLIFVGNNYYSDVGYSELYYWLTLVSVSGSSYTFSYERRDYVTTSSPTSSLSGYVYGPSTSSFSTGSTYKNRVSL